MDRGAARSRKREEKAQKVAERDAADGPAKQDDKSSDKPKGERERKERKPRPQKKPFDPSDKSQYRPKAIRSSNALIYSQEAFELPPSAERLAGVTRVDLEGSGATDVSWLAGTGVTWLNLKGCVITEGWESVGALEGLAVLNISACGLSALPKELGALKNLKALVAMNNEWTELDGGVVVGWDQLNSMIVSHSPNLTSLPTTLATLPHLAKLTLSHCAKLSASGLPDLSALPLLRDVRANNLPRLTTIPSHLATWGTGNLSLAGKESKDGAERKGSGLEVLDLGNCSLPLSSISELFALSLPPGAKPKHTWQLRSITLQANPLTLEDETYADALQRSPALPRLQIIDSKRVVERKNAGAQPESKAERKARERQERKMGPTGANADAGGKKEMRAWGGEEAREKGEKFGNADKGGKKRPREERERRGKEGKPRFADKERTRPPRDVKDKASAAVPKRKRDADAEPPAKKRKEKESFFVDVDGDKPPPAAKPKAASAPKQTPTPAPKATATEAAEADRPAKKRKRKHGKSGAEEPETSAPARATTPAKAAQAPKAEAPRQAGRPEKKKLTKSETAVVGVVEVARPKAGGIDLKSVVAKESASGLDVGGW